MEDVSFYFTILSLISLQVAFFWLLKHDGNTRILTKDSIVDKKLAIVLANSLVIDSGGGQNLFRLQLERKGFIVYDIQFVDGEEDIISTRDSNRKQDQSTGSGKAGDRKPGARLRVNPNLAKHREQAAAYLSDQLKLHQLKLHSFVSFPIEPSNVLTSNLDPLELSQRILSSSLGPSFELLTALLPSIEAHGARVIRIQDARFASSACNPTSGVASLYLSLEEKVGDFLRENLLLRRAQGQRLIDVTIIGQKGSGSSEQGTTTNNNKSTREGSSRMLRKLKQLLASTRASFIRNFPSSAQFMGLTKKPDAIKNQLDHRASNVIVDLVAQVNPKLIKIVIEQ